MTLTVTASKNQRKQVTTDRSSVDSLTVGFYDKSNKCQVPTSKLHHILSLDTVNLTIIEQKERDFLNGVETKPFDLTSTHKSFFEHPKLGS